MTNNYLPTSYQSFIALSRYARWLPDEGRRENWGETVNRYMTNIVRPAAGDDSYINQIEEAILNLEVMPSMRAMMTAGKAADRDNTCIYNCSYLLPIPKDDFFRSPHTLSARGCLCMPSPHPDALSQIS